MKHYGRFFVALFLVDALLSLLALHFVPEWQPLSNLVSTLVACFTLPLLVLVGRNLLAPRLPFAVMSLFYLASMALGVVMMLSIDPAQLKAASDAGAVLSLLRSEVPWFEAQERITTSLQVCVGVWGVMQWQRIGDGPAVALPEQDPRREALTGLGGWLVLLGIGVVLMPCLVFFSVATEFLPVLSDGNVQAMVLPGSDAFRTPVALLLLGELLGNLALFAGTLYVAVAFFRRQARFRTAYIVMAIAYIGVFTLDAIATELVFPDTEMLDEETTKAIRSAMWAAAIWIPYVLVSRRARYTFVR